MAGLDQTTRAILAGAPDLIHTPTLAVGAAQAVQADPTGTLDPQGTAAAIAVAAGNVGIQQGAQDLNATPTGAEDVAAPTTPEQANAPKPKHHGGGGIFGSLIGGIEGDVLHPAERAANAVMNPVEDVATKVANPIEHAAGYALHALTVPLSVVQHAYRTDHEEITRYGVWNFIESHFPGMSSGASANRRTAWNVTANGETYRDKYGNAVNPGFDLANVVDHVVNGHDYMPAGWHRDANGVMQRNTDAQGNPTGGIDIPTGIANAVFDLSMDPLLKAGKIAKAIRLHGLEVGGKVIDLSQDPAVRARQLADITASGKPVQYTEDQNQAVVGARVLYQGRAVRPLVDFDGNRASNIYDVAQNNPAVNDAFQRLAQASTKDIVTQYPMLRPIAAQLGNANTVKDVADVFHDALTVRNYSFVSNGLPATGVTRRALAKVGIDTPTFQGAASEAIDSLPKPMRAAFSYRPFTLDSRTMKLSGSEFDPEDPASINGFRNVLLYSQKRDVADAIVARYLEAPSLGERVNIITNAFRDTLRAAGVPDEHDLMLRWSKDIDFMNKNALRPVYGVDENGMPIRLLDPETGEPVSLGLLNNQTGKIAFPQFNEMRSAIADSRAGWDPRRVGFKVDDWLYNHYTTRIFKNLVLLSLGFGLRVAGGELVPATLAHDARGVAGSAAMAASAKLNPTLRDLATEHPDGLVGLDAHTAKGLGRVTAVDPETKRLTVEYGDGTQYDHNANAVTLMQRPVNDQELMRQARSIGVQITGDEIPHYKAAISKALYGVGRALVDEEFRKQAAFNIMTLEGHLVAPGLMSNHDVLMGGAGRTEDLREYIRQAGARVPDKPQRLSDAFTTYDSDNNNHPMFWHFAIHEAAKDPGVQKGAQAYLDAIRGGASKEDATQAFVNADKQWMLGEGEIPAQFRYKMALYGQGADNYSAMRAELLKGLIHGKNGQLNNDVLEGIAGRADVPNVASLAERDKALRPVAVKGRELQDIPDPGSLERITAWGWRKALHPVINGLSRAPIFTLKTAEEYKFLQPWVDAGVLPEAEARQIAQVRGANAMLPLIHNTKLRSQMSDVFRNIVPFYFAQEQAYKRYGRVMIKDPVAFQKAILAAHGLYGSGVIRQDETGANHVVIPGGGEFAKWWTTGAQALGLPVVGGLPSVLSGNTISLKTVVPEGTLPSTSPLVAVPLKAMQAMFPATEPMVSKVIGPVAEQESAWDAMIPNQTIKRLLQATPLLDRERAFTTSYMNAIAWAAHRADVLRTQAAALPDTDPRKQALLARAESILPGPNADIATRQHALDRIKNSTRILSIFKALVGAVSPLSPSVDVGDVQLREELRKDIQQHGLANGVNVFTEKHPTATADTVFMSDSKYTGTALPATQAALQWVQDNRTWAQNHILASAYLIPQQAGKYDQEAYNQELALGLRQRKSPEELVNAIYAAATNVQFFKDVKNYDAAKAAAANDPVRLRQLKQSWTEYTQQLSNANPVWYADLNDSNKQQVAQQALFQIRSALADPNTPYSPQTAIVAGLVNDYDNYQKYVAAAKAGRTNVTVSQLQDSWKKYLDDEATAQPEAAAFIHGVLRRLPN